MVLNRAGHASPGASVNYQGGEGRNLRRSNVGSFWTGKCSVNLFNGAWNKGSQLREVWQRKRLRTTDLEGHRNALPAHSTVRQSHHCSDWSQAHYPPTPWRRCCCCVFVLRCLASCAVKKIAPGDLANRPFVWEFYRKLLLALRFPKPRLRIRLVPLASKQVSILQFFFMTYSSWEFIRSCLKMSVYFEALSLVFLAAQSRKFKIKLLAECQKDFCTFVF